MDGHQLGLGLLQMGLEFLQHALPAGHLGFPRVLHFLKLTL